MLDVEAGQRPALPGCESDHIFTHVYNQYVGGRCIEDIANLPHSDAIKQLFGASRISDSTTAGDFLRRFEEAHLQKFQAVIDRGARGGLAHDAKVAYEGGHCRSKRPCAIPRRSFRAGSASDRRSTPRWRLGLASAARNCARGSRPRRSVLPCLWQMRSGEHHRAVQPQRGAATRVRPHNPQLAPHRSPRRPSRHANVRQSTRARLFRGWFGRCNSQAV